jgi:hypothetical protein
LSLFQLFPEVLNGMFKLNPFALLINSLCDGEQTQTAIAIY